MLFALFVVYGYALFLLNSPLIASLSENISGYLVYPPGTGIPSVEEYSPSIVS